MQLRRRCAAGCGAPAVCVTTATPRRPGARPDLEHVEAGAAAQQLGRDLPPVCSVAARRRRTAAGSGRRGAGRSRRRCAWSGASEISRASVGEVLAARARAPAPPRRARARSATSASLAPSGTATRICAMLSLRRRCRRAARCSLDELVDVGVADLDLGLDLALAQRARVSIWLRRSRGTARSRCLRPQPLGAARRR